MMGGGGSGVKVTMEMTTNASISAAMVRPRRCPPNLLLLSWHTCLSLEVWGRDDVFLQVACYIVTMRYHR